MDVYGMSSAGQDYLGVDELFDFSGDRDDVFSSSAVNATDGFNTSTASGSQYQYGFSNDNGVNTNYQQSTDFTDHFCVPSDDVAELEWLSRFVDDSFSDFPTNNIAGTINFRPQNTSFHSRSRSKRTRAPSNNNSWTSTPVPTTPISETSKTKRENYSSATSSSCETSETGVVRRCTHCASEKTPQWRTGPLGPKTLCNACGVRYKSGRLVPEYRPAASPTFVLTQHSNSHRKVMELRRQKEVMLGGHHPHYQQQQQQLPPSEHQIYGGAHHHHHRQQQQVHHGSNYEVC